MTELSSERLLSRWEDRRRIINLMGKYTAHYLIKREKDIFAGFWSKEDDISLGVNTGYYYGREAVAGYYTGLHEANLLRSSLIKAAYPQKLGDKTDEEVYGVGILDYKPLDTGVVEIAGDGKTAKGIWCCRGSYNELTGEGPISYWEWSVFAGDFIREDDDWRIWHLLYLKEIDSPCGQNWIGERKHYPEVPEFAAMDAFKMPEPNIKTPLRSIYGQRRKFSPLPDCPEPYETFGETFSYGVSGGAEI